MPIDFSITKEQWKEDLDYLFHKITKEHLNPYHLVHQKELEQNYAEAYEKLDNANGTNAAVVLAEFAASIGDGHTYASPYREFNRFPVRLRWFGNKLKIITLSRSFKKYQGWEIVKLGKSSIMEVIQSVSRLIPRGESNNLIKNYSAYYLTLHEVLVALDLIQNKSELELTVKSEKGDVERITISLNDTELVPVFKKTPLLFSSPKPLYHQKLNETEIGYLNFSGYLSTTDMKKYGNEVDIWLQKEKIHTLIIDFRENGGGDFQKGRTLLKEIQRTILAKNISVYVAIGMFTFSAGMSNACDFQKGLNGKFIGEISGARPNGYQENNDFTLPNSKIPCSYSSRYYTFSEVDTPGIIPHIEITYNWHDFFHGKDPLIYWVITNR